MRAFFSDLVAALDPRPTGPDGPLPALLLLLTVVTGFVDALSYLVLGHVFVTNMTGNVVFLGFSLGGVGQFSVLASLTAIAAFGVGALACGRLTRDAPTRAALLARAVSVQWVLIAVGLGLWALLGASGPGALAVTAALAAGMGMQNHAARVLKVADLTTTVLTLTITGLFADSAGASRPHQGRRVLSVLCMALGAALGALLVLRSSPGWVFAVCLVLLAVVAAAGWRWRRSDAPWNGA